MNRLFLLGFFFLTTPCFSQLQDSIAEVNIVTLHVPMNVEETGRSISIITGRELQTLPVSSVEEALRSLVGVNINSRGGFGVQSDIGLRGSTFSQTLVLLDGIRFTDPLTGHLNNAIPVPLSEIAKIEVIRGPASAVYGADAVGGVIHIQTKTFVNQTATKYSTTGTIYYGQNNLIDADVSAHKRLGKVTISAGYKHTSSDGEQYTNPNFTEDENFNNTYFISDKFATFFEIESFTVATQFRPTNNWQVNARFAKDKRDYNAKYFYTRSSLDESVEENEFYLGQFSATKTTENTRTNAAFGFRESSDDFAFNPAFAANQHTTKRFTSILTHEWKTATGNQFVLGTQAAETSIKSTDRGNHRNHQMEVFGTSLLQLSDQFSTVISMRGGHHSITDFTLTPQASFSWQLPNAVLRSSIGTAIRSADFTEQYVSFNLPQVAAERNIGNPFLENEHAFSVDLGADLLFNNSVEVSATTFFRSTNNLIDYTIVNESEINYLTNLVQNANYFQAQNVGKANTFGVEVETETEHQLSTTAELTTNLNYTYINTNLGEDVVSKYLANHPNHQIQLNIACVGSKFSGSLINQFVARNEDAVADFFTIRPNYLVSNAKFGYELLDQVQLSVKVNNLWDQSYQEILGAQMPGRWTMAGLQWDFE